MKNKKEITCIICPIGCKITVRTDSVNCEIVKGNKCNRGVEYAYSEALDPKRMLASTILVENGQWPLVSVKSSKAVPKNKIFEVLKEIKQKKVKAPVKIGHKIIKNVANTKIDIIATKNVDKKN